MSFDLDQYTEEHRQGWASFIKLTIYGTAGVIALLVLLALFLL